MSSHNETDEGIDPDSFRKLGNSHFANGDYDSALVAYDAAVSSARSKDVDNNNNKSGNDDVKKENNELLVIHLCNRSACYFKMDLFEEAMSDAEEALGVSHGMNSKASFRLARAQMALSKYSDAILVLEKALAILEEPSEGENVQITQQRADLSKLLATAKKKRNNGDGEKETKPPIVCIKTDGRLPSIKEFQIQRELGVGNFSRIVACRHKTTSELFALKIIEKKKAESLAKRQHPNVYNEINMERRILGERLPFHRRTIQMYHAFQDYNNLYFLMDLHVEGGDLWSSMKMGNKMVGCPPSLAKIYLFEILEALEHLHSHGIIHRDLKTENVLLSKHGHVILIDFGTAKDMVKMDLNGPEFVGTPDFMSPEAVKGASGSDEVKEAKAKGEIGADHATDLWALGAMAFQLYTGMTPFASPSPYLAFLKIQRGNIYRPLGIDDDDAWDLIQKLLVVDPRKRLGADSFDFTKSTDKDSPNVVASKYDAIRNHPYFVNLKIDEKVSPVLSPRDTQIRSLAEMVQKDSLNLDIDKEHPPGDGSSHDMTQLSENDRRGVMHIIDRLKLLSEPRMYRRFFRTKQESRLNKVRVETRDYVGLTQLNDNQGQFPSLQDENDGSMEVSSVPLNLGPIQFAVISNPLFNQETNSDCAAREDGESLRATWIGQLKDSIRQVNRTRPKLVVACGYIDEQCRKLFAKVNETIPVVLADGSSFFSFWICGAQGLVLCSNDFGLQKDKGDMTEKDSSIVQQKPWLREQLEQSRTTSHPTFAFVDCNPAHIPQSLIRSLARGKTVCLMGVSSDSDTISTCYKYERGPQSKKGDDDDDSSLDEDEDFGSHELKIISAHVSTPQYITLEDRGGWKLGTD